MRLDRGSALLLAFDDDALIARLLGLGASAADLERGLRHLGGHGTGGNSRRNSGGGGTGDLDRHMAQRSKYDSRSEREGDTTRSKVEGTRWCL